MAASFSDMDNFFIEFPATCTPDDKALLMAAGLLLDYTYFEERQGKKG